VERPRVEKPSEQVDAHGVTTGPSVRLPTVHTRLRGVPGQSEPSRSADRYRARPGLTLRDPSAAVRRVNHAGRTPGRELPVPPFPGVPGGWGSRGLAAVGGSCRPPFPGVPGFLGLLGAHGGLPPWVGAAGRRSRVSWVPGAPGGSRGLAPVGGSCRPPFPGFLGSWGSWGLTGACPRVGAYWTACLSCPRWRRSPHSCASAR